MTVAPTSRCLFSEIYGSKPLQCYTCIHRQIYTYYGVTLVGPIYKCHYLDNYYPGGIWLLIA